MKPPAKPTTTAHIQFGPLYNAQKPEWGKFFTADWDEAECLHIGAQISGKDFYLDTPTARQLHAIIGEYLRGRE